MEQEPSKVTDRMNIHLGGNELARSSLQVKPRDCSTRSQGMEWAGPDPNGPCSVKPLDLIPRGMRITSWFLGREQHGDGDIEVRLL